MAKHTPPRRPKSGAKTRVSTEEPVFAQPQPSPDPTTFKNPVTDQNYTEIANLEPVPQPVDGAVEPILTLAQTYGSAGEAKLTTIQQAKQIVFHSVGDTGSVIGPDTQSLVPDKMVSDFDEYFTFDAPFVRILGLYSNVLEDPGVISSQGGTNSLDDRRITFLTTALKRVKSENYTGAVIIAVHHPPFTGDSTDGGSPQMLADIDAACTAAVVWPHAVFSGHAHNYQRFTRTVNGIQIPYLVAGCGGHSPLAAMRGTYRTPYKIDDTLTLESYDDTDYGYLRVVVNAQTLTIEFHPESDGGVPKTPDDTVTVNLQTRAIS
jgi:hypothetical protein